MAKTAPRDSCGNMGYLILADFTGLLYNIFPIEAYRYLRAKPFDPNIM